MRTKARRASGRLTLRVSYVHRHQTKGNDMPKDSKQAECAVDVSSNRLLCAKAECWEIVYPAIIFLLEARNLPPSGWETLRRAKDHYAKAHNAELTHRREHQ